VDRFPIARLRHISTARCWGCTGAIATCASTATTSSHPHRMPGTLPETGRDPVAIVWGCHHRPAPAGHPAACIHRCAIAI